MTLASTIYNPFYLLHNESIKLFFFLPIILLMPFFYQGEKSMLYYLNIGFLFILYHVGYSFIQIFNYFVFHRLPALAYLGGLARFGGGWDDPNGFGVFLILPIILMISLRNHVKNKKINNLLLIILILLLLITFSFSAYGGFIIALLSYSIIGSDKKIYYVIFGLVMFATLIIISNHTLYNLLTLLISNKSGSIQDHLTYLGLKQFLYRGHWYHWIFGFRLHTLYHETYYLRIFMNYGIIGEILLLSLIGWTVVEGINKSVYFKKRQDFFYYKLFSALTAYVLGFSAVGFVIPSFIIFPVNVIFWVVIAIIWLTDKKHQLIYHGPLFKSSGNIIYEVSKLE